ncbi:uncharacterized protein FOBCDRAFT_245654 [Fusarium oxysporum Fo47]|uniref:uncharacterized protein n=1 Tax=Fusarium oxysporum Fo47 TaxID=660027 RepID=UPI002869E0B3|nr:uncharacterized protein FOBCDRAFT_245654 [Fusarium oxysporum Fo47]WJG37226.1 hypothetical protein FOBCDRAFT_245654 [Fusarium oxysporum Fo47]
MSISPAVQDLLDRNKAIVPQFQPLNLSLAAGTKPLPMVAVNCGFSHMTQSNIHADLQRRFPEADPAYIDSLPFRTIDRYAQLPLSRSAVLLNDIQFIHNSVLVKKEPKDLTVGFIVDINTGQLTQVQGIVADAPQ